MEIEKNIDMERGSPQKEEESQQNEGIRVTDKLSDIKQIKGFTFQLRNSKSNEEKLSDLNVLSQTPSHILYSTPGLRTIGEWVYELSDNVPENAEVLEKIFGLLKELQFKTEHLENAHYLGLGIEKMHIAQQNTEDSEGFNMFYKFYYLNKQTINEWIDSFRKRSQDPNFKRQFLWSEQNKYLAKKQNNNNNAQFHNNNNKFPQNNYQGNKFNPNNNNNNNFQKVNNKNGNTFQRGDSPPTQKKLKQNNGNGYNGYNANNQRDFQNGKKCVSFAVEDLVKRFRKEDEPNVPDMTDAEVETYQQECLKKKQQSIHVFVNAQDMRERENKLEKESRNQQIESEKKERQKLDEMKPDCNWRIPIKIKQLDSQFFQNLSSESFEKKLHEKRILCKMQSLYVSDSDIPSRPSYENVINDQISEIEPKQIYLNKLDESDFIQVIEMAIKNGGSEPNKKAEKNVLKSILKVSKEEKELQRKKMIEEKRKQDEEEERIKKQLNFATLNQLIDLIMNNKNNTREELIQGVKDLGLSEKELHSIYQNINIIKSVQQQRNKETLRPSFQNAENNKDQEQNQNNNYTQQNSNLNGNKQDINNNNNNNNNSNNFQNNSIQQNHPNNNSSLGQQNNSYNQFNGNQMNSQQNYQNKYQNNFNNNNIQNQQIKPQDNNYNNQMKFNNNNNVQNQNQRFENNNGLNKNNQNLTPSFNNQSQNNQFVNNEQNQQKPFQNYQQNQQNQFSYNQQQQQHQYQPQQQQQQQQQGNQQQYQPQQQQTQQQGNFNNQQQNTFNNNRVFPPRQNNTIPPPPPPPQPQNNNQMSQYNQQQNNQLNNFQQNNFNNNQNQTQQQQQTFQPQKQLNNNMNGNQNKPFQTFQNQQNNVPKFNQNQSNQTFQQGHQNHQMGQAPIQKQQGDEIKTVPCRLYHSEAGCKRDVCNFLHIPEYQGRTAPYVPKGQRYESNQSNQQNNTMQTNGISIPPPPPQNNQKNNNSNYQQNQQFGGYKPQQPQQQFSQQSFNQQREEFQQQQQPPQQQQNNNNNNNNNMFLIQKTNPLLKQQFKAQPTN